MNPQIHIDYADGRLLIRCPFYANDLVKDLPSRRWSKAKQAWAVTMVRKNVEQIRVKLQPFATITPAAQEAMARVEKASAKPVKSTFPAWYPFKTQPLKHQWPALHQGYGLNSFALFMDMQTGKSKVAIDLNCCWRMENKIQAVAIACKRTLRDNWVVQWETHAPIPYSIHLPDTGKMREFEEWMSAKHDLPVLVFGWESLSQGRMPEMVERFLLAHGRVGLIGDETTYIAGHDAERSRHTVRFGRMADRRLALTGTPILDGPMNLYMQFEYLDPNIIGIGDFYAFRNRYAVMGGFRKTPKGPPLQIVGYQNMDELVETVAPYVYQVLKKDAYELPPKRYQRRTVELTKKQKDILLQIKKNDSIMFKGEELVIQNVLEQALRRHQVVGGYTVRGKEVVRGDKVKMVYEPIEILPWKDNPKVQEVMAVVEESRHTQGIIWCVYQPEIQACVRALTHMGIKFGQLHGLVPDPERMPQVKQFNAGGLQWMIGNASTGGMGYTMMASEINVFYNNTFKMVDRVQAEDRAYGHGQTKSPAYVDIVAEKTIDTTILKALEQKQNLADFVRGRIKHLQDLLDGLV
jgi:hypothetical protein